MSALTTGGLRVILASQSPRRRELLHQVGIAHDVMPADVDETYLVHEAPAPHAERLARLKAATLAAEHPHALVIGADTIVVIDGMVLGKPADAADAHRMLERLSGRTHWVYTAVAVARDGALVSGVEAVEVTFRPLSTRQVQEYVATGEPMDKAGGYGIQGFGATLVERIHGDYFAVMGLALGRLVLLLREVGVTYHFGTLVDARPPQ
jgi:septum formation protein